MDTPSYIADRIAAAALDRFATDNRIDRAHLTTDTDGITPPEIARAFRALGGSAVVLGG